MKKNRSKKNIRVFLFCIALAILPRLPLIFHNTAFPMSDAAGMLRAGTEFLTSGHYDPSRRPGSFIYDVALALIYFPFKTTGIPFFYITNLFTAVCSAITLYFLYKIFRIYFSEIKAALAVILFNFWPREFAMGGGTADINFLLMWLVIAYFYVEKKQLYTAFAFSLCAVSSRIQGLSLAFPIALLILFNSFKRGSYRRLAKEAAVCLLLTLVVFFPLLNANGLNTFIQPYHKDEFTKSQLIGAFILRSLNLFGPIGLCILIGAAIKTRLYAEKRIYNERTFLAIFHTAITLLAMYKAPWETYYLLPIVPVGVFLFFSLKLKPLTQAIFVVSYLLPLVVQLQFKPWKVPPYEVRPGVIDTQWHENWIFWGGG